LCHTPRYTLFPYTTLFRSVEAGRSIRLHRRAHRFMRELALTHVEGTEKFFARHSGVEMTSPTMRTLAGGSGAFIPRQQSDRSRRAFAASRGMSLRILEERARRPNGQR